MRPFAATLVLSAFLSRVDAQERLSVRGPADVLDRFAGLSEAIARWHPDLDVAWVPYESGVTFAPLFDGSADLLVSPRGIEPWEQALAAKLSLEIHEHIAALDAVSVVVHRDNRVESLSIEQIQTLFSGKIVGWYGFGGSDRPVRLVAPLPSSGEYQALRRISPGGDFRLPPSAEIASSSAGVLSTVASDPRAVGLVSMSLDSSSVRTVPLRATPAASAAPSDAPVLPSADSVERGEYPWSRILWLYSRGSADEDLQRLLSCLLSSEGQAEIAKAGFVAVAADRAFQRTLPARERSRGATVTRVSFAPGFDRLDREARDVLTQLRERAAEVWITGHAELLEDRPGDRGLSERRARAVEVFLTTLGVAVAGAEGVGAESGDLRGADVWWISRR
jgi:phosphate transport system substrate-binding protein